MPSIIDDTGHERHLGNLDAPLRLTWSRYGDTPSTPLIPRAEWKARIDAMAGPGPDGMPLPPAHDQDGIGMCNCSATAGALESARLKAGDADVRLSAGDLYIRISGGRDNGSTLEDGLAEAMAHGIAPVSVNPYLSWRSSQGTPATRAPYRVVNAFLCPTFDHCMSAVMEGFDLVSGVVWCSNYTPGADGWLPPGRGQAGGHAVHGYKPTYKGDAFGIWHQNSWGSTWGLQGRCVFPEAMYSGPIGGWWAIRCVVDDDNSLPTPKGL